MKSDYRVVGIEEWSGSAGLYVMSCNLSKHGFNEQLWDEQPVNYCPYIKFKRKRGSAVPLGCRTVEYSRAKS